MLRVPAGSQQAQSVRGAGGGGSVDIPDRHRSVCRIVGGAMTARRLVTKRCQDSRVGGHTLLSDFLETFSPDSAKRGKQFEHFVKWFLTNDPEWAAEVQDVWLWNDYPGRWGRDCGIDLVFKDKT